MRKLLICCILLVVFGILDCATTFVGVAFYGAKESNPMLISLTESNMLGFIGFKLFMVICIGISFYGAGKLVRPVADRLQLGKYLFCLTYSGTLVVLVFAFTNNMIVVASLI